MSKAFYSEYVRHIMRFYSRNLQLTSFKSKADKSNWLACDGALEDYPETSRNILIAVYSGFDTLADNVYTTAKKYNVKQAVIWDLIKDLEYKIAKIKGLI